MVDIALLGERNRKLENGKWTREPIVLSQKLVE
jgi:hypothetical protein